MNPPLVLITVRNLINPEQKQAINIKASFSSKYHTLLAAVVNIGIPSEQSTETKVNHIFKSIKEEVDNKENIDFDPNRNLIKNNIFKELEGKLAVNNSLKEGIDLKVYMLFYEKAKEEFPEYKFTNSPEKILENQLKSIDPLSANIFEILETLISGIQKIKDTDTKKNLFQSLEKKLIETINDSMKMLFYKKISEKAPEYKFNELLKKACTAQINIINWDDVDESQISNMLGSLIDNIKEIEDPNTKKSLFETLEKKFVEIRGSKRIYNDIKAYTEFRKLVSEIDKSYEFLVDKNEFKKDSEPLKFFPPE
jgi:hypothetical protein